MLPNLHESPAGVRIVFHGGFLFAAPPPTSSSLEVGTDEILTDDVPKKVEKNTSCTDLEQKSVRYVHKLIH